MSNISKRRREGSRAKIKSMGDHKEFLTRITKTLYYGQLPSLPCLSLPVTEISCEVWSAMQRGRSVRRLHADAASGVSRAARVSPAALVLALLYVERLRASAPHYLAAVAPHDLFLVTLMVGNKFLQDDGEDEETVCSDWAASGGMDLDQLKRLELQFLGAIDWNVFVNEKSFERGLQWLERRVALKQARLRGFFTYSDLTVAGDAALLGAELLTLAAAGAAATVAYVAGLVTLLSSALFLPALTPLITLQNLAPPSSLSQHSLDATADIITHSFPPPLTLTQYIPNSTVDPTSEDLERVLSPADREPCCARWRRYRQETVLHKPNWSDSVVLPDLKTEPWWAHNLEWLYRSSLVNPMQRWLEKINEYIDLYKRLRVEPVKYTQQCREYGEGPGNMEQQCVRQWLNLSKLSALFASVSDR